MPNFAKLFLIAVFVFMIPITVVLGMQWEEVVKFVSVDPTTAKGYVLYFTSYR